MARTTKKGLEYFPMDIDIFSNIKIRKLIKYQGGKAVSVYALLLCNIYKCGYYMKWDNELPFICSELTGFEEAYISEVVKTCLSLGLFSKELFDTDKVLTSKSIQERYERICIQCRRVIKIDDYSLLTPQETKHSKTSKNKKEEEKQIVPQFEPYRQTLDQEIEQLKEDEIWLDGLQGLLSTHKDKLRESLADFRLQCIADGKEGGHTSIADAKQHFNNWYRKKQQIKRNGKSTKQTIGFSVSATSAEDYKDWLHD